MTKEEKELAITYLKRIKKDYIEGEGYDVQPLPEYCAIQMGIKALEKELSWIPISERLPKDAQRVLMTVVNYTGHEVVRVAEYYSEIGIFQGRENSESWKVGEEGLLAWMPLPEPYNAESDE